MHLAKMWQNKTFNISKSFPPDVGKRALEVAEQAREKKKQKKEQRLAKKKEEEEE